MDKSKTAGSPHASVKTKHYPIKWQFPGVDNAKTNR
jgi:hypothetical protein